MAVENGPEIIAITRRDWRLMDPSGPEFESFIELPPGTHRLELKPSPYGGNEMWLVLKGTQIGKPIKSWLAFQDCTDDFQVKIEGSVPPPTRV